MGSTDVEYNLVSFQPEQTSEATRNLNEQLLKAAQKDRKWWEVGAATYRRMRAEGKTPFPPYTFLPAQEVEIASRDADRTIPCRVLRPQGDAAPRGILLHIHGGGFVLGTAAGQDHYLAQIKQATGLIVISVEYRLAPEHVYPAAVQDCEDVADWLYSNASSEFGCEMHFIGGESAGGTLSTTTLLHLKRQGRHERIRGVLLGYGCFDLTFTASVYTAPKEMPILTLEDASRFLDTYLNMGYEARKNGQVSPAYNDLTGLCPAIFIVGTEDALVDDSVLMHFRWLRAGNEALLKFVPGAPHGFLVFENCEVAGQARQLLIDFINSHI